MVLNPSSSIGKDVWFDDLVVDHYENAVLEEDHYYPFGLTLQTTPNTTNTTQQPYKYNGKKLEKSFGLEMYETPNRGLDPQLGRFTQIDPMAEATYGISPFASMNNNPVLNVDPLGLVAGDYYKDNGEYLGNDGKDDDKVYVVDKAPAVDASVEGTGQDKATELPTTGTEFRQTANVVRQEGLSSDPNEYLYIAHANNNEAEARGTDMNSLIMTSYSSVPDKSELSNINTSTNANSARAGVISVLSGEADPTGGARLWDGTDFLAWGLSSPNGTPQNKFEEYNSITISKGLYDSYKQGNNDKWGNSVRYSGTSYNIPAKVFTDKANWSTGNFRYNTGARAANGLEATATAGQTIFWKITSNP